MAKETAPEQQKMETLGIEPRLITDRIEEMRSNCRNHLTISPVLFCQVNEGFNHAK